MSVLNLSIFLVMFIVGCFGSWNAALRWHNKTRDARKEDPRDQEIRELGAALNIARKEADRLGTQTAAQGTELDELKEKMQQSSDALADVQQKFNATRESLTHEIEGKEALDAELMQLRRDLEIAQTRVAEIEVQERIAPPGSGFVAGIDDMIEDDEKEVFTIRQEHRQMKAQLASIQQKLDEQLTEAERWKQHCTVMSTTNKALRKQVDELSTEAAAISALRDKAERLETVEARNQELVSELAQLDSMRAELEEAHQRTAGLQTELNGLLGVQAENEGLQSLVVFPSAAELFQSRLQPSFSV